MDILQQLKQIQAEQTRAGIVFTSVVQELENELERMKDKKLSQDFIDTKDSQIENLIHYFNTTDTLFQFYKIACINLNMELKVTESLLITTASNREALIEKLVAFKLQRNG